MSDLTPDEERDNIIRVLAAGAENGQTATIGAAVCRRIVELLSAEPAPVGVEITDEAAAVEAMARTQIIGTWEQKTERERGVHLRRAQRALEAARPFMTSRPALDREAVRRILDRAAYGEHRETLADAVMALAVPVPTREQIEQALVECGIGSYRTIVTNAVLALLNGSAKL